METAVEWLVDKLLKGEFINDTDGLIAQAKEMEKQQIIDSRELLFHGTPEQYYNETFKSE
jgi:hypothetical protein